jgi:Phosphotransferase enzyme family
MDERVELGDGVVSRPAHPWTPTIHALLRYLHSIGFDRVPRPIAIEGERETLRLIAGESGAAGWSHVAPEDGLRSFALFLREYHDAIVGFEPLDEPRWAFRDGLPSGDEVVFHGDFAPWNVVWQGGEPVGLLDFDFAEPGDRMLDVAYALDYIAPFCDDDEARRWRGYGGAPDRRDRIDVFFDAYGLPAPRHIVDVVIARRELDIEHVRSLAGRGIEPQRTWVADGMLTGLADRVRWVREHRSWFE